MARFFLIGANGQLGRDLAARLPGEVLPAGRDQADLTKPEILRSTLQTARPDCVVNCAAYNFVDRAESESEDAFAINAVGVRNLALICAELDQTLVHFSTDYVFGLDTARREPYAETDAPAPISVYGASKLAGEQFVRAICPRHFVIRSCGLYGLWGLGGKGGNFVETMLKLAERGQSIRVVTDEVCAPTYAADLADATVALIGTNRFGLYHITNGGACSRFEFAQEIFRQAGMTVEVTPTTQHEYGAAARRPTYAVLSMNRYEALRLPRLRSWQDALAAYLRERAGRIQQKTQPV
jgi:dTDP-4-dehydrorhamnose reductase